MIKLTLKKGLQFGVEDEHGHTMVVDGGKTVLHTV